MNTDLVHLPAGPPPGVIGFNTRNGRVIGLREAASVSFSTLAKATWAAAIGRSVVRTRQLMGDQAADKALAVTLKRQRDEAVNRAAYLEALLHTTARPPALLIEAAPAIDAPAKVKRPRWSAAERRFLAAELARRSATRPGYAAIALLMEAEFQRPFTAASIGTQGRRLRAAAEAPPPAAKPATKRRRARTAA